MVDASGTSLAEFDELENLAARHGTPVMVGLNRRNYTVLRNALAPPYVGTLPGLTMLRKSRADFKLPCKEIASQRPAP